MVEFMRGDKVALVKDFNNEPGIIPKGSTGTVVGVYRGKFTEDQIFVRFDNLSDELYVQMQVSRDIGMPMHSDEIKKIAEDLYEVTGIDRQGNRTLLHCGINFSYVTDILHYATSNYYSVDVRKISE